MHRRAFLGTGFSTLAAALPAWPPWGGRAQSAGSTRFGLDYAPHFGMFRHHAGEDRIDQIRFMHDEGFRALEDNALPERDIATQERIGSELSRLGMRMGVFVAHADWREASFAYDAPEVRARILADMDRAVEVAKRVDARWCTVVPGQYDPGVPGEYQTTNVVDNLKTAKQLGITISPNVLYQATKVIK